MPGRRTKFAVIGAASVVLVGLTALVTADAVSAPSAAVHACQTSKGYLSLASSSGKCASGQTAVTINKQGPKGATGARGPAGASGLPKAVVLTKASADVGPASYGEHGLYPAAMVVARFTGIPVGTYLVAGSMHVKNGESSSGGEITCYLVRAGTNDFVGGWDDTIGIGGVANESFQATTGSSDLDLRCINFNTGEGATLSSIEISLTPVASIRTITGKPVKNP